MALHSSPLAWKIPWMEEPGRLQSMGSLRVGHDSATSLSLFTFMHWRRKWQPTPVILPEESQGWGSLVGCRLWGRTELDTTEVTQQQQQQMKLKYQNFHGTLGRKLFERFRAIGIIAWTYIKICSPTWRRKWQPTPAFLPGKSQGRRNLVGYSPWDHKELDMTE